jgi:hypothetical protein
VTVVADSSGSRARGEPGRDRRALPPSTSPGRLVSAGVLAALRASVTGLVLCILVGLAVGWSTDGLTVAGTVGLGADLWLAAHHVPIVFAHGNVGLLPLGLLLLPVVILVRAGGRLAREVEVAGLWQAGVALAALAVPYACAGGVAAVSTLAQTDHAAVLWAPVGTLLVALLAGGVGVLRGAGLGLRLATRVPARVRPVLVAGIGAVATLVAGGAVLVTVMLAVHVVRVRDITASLHAGGLGEALLFVAGALYVPNTVLYAVAYAAGTGFSLGAGTIVAPWRFAGGPLPSFPLLGAVPTGTPPAVAWLVLAVPVLAGVVAGVLLVRHTLPRSLPRAAASGVAVGPPAGLVVGVLTALAGGSLGAHRLAWLGPDPWLTGLAVAGEIAVVTAVAAVVASWLTRRRIAPPPRDDAPVADSAGAGEPSDEVGGGERDA